MAKIIFLVDDDFEQVEYTEVRDGLKQAGHQTQLVSLKKPSVQGWNHNQRADTFKVDGQLADRQITEFDALVLPGGVMNSDSLRVDASAQQAVQQMFKAGKTVAAICHAPWLLISAQQVQGRTLTAYHTLADDLRNAGAHYVDQTCVVDDGLITSRKPEDIAAFVQAIDAAVR